MSLRIRRTIAKGIDWMRTARHVTFFLVLLVIVSSVALAHMQATKMDPEDGATVKEAPKWVQIWYSQEPDSAVSKLTLTGPDGEVKLFVHPSDDNSLMGMVQQDNLRDGEYTVEWQAAGDDGHIQKGEYKFTLKTD